MTERTPVASSIEHVRKLEVKGAAELARFYNIPPPLMNMYFVQFGEELYPKESFLLHQGHKRGIQRIEIDKPQQENGEWKTEVRIFPLVTAPMIEAISRLPEAERREAWKYLTTPVREWGRASVKNVRMSTMHEWLDAIAIKRAVCRGLRLFVGYGGTSYEELPDVIVDSKDLRESRSLTVTDGDAAKEESRSETGTRSALPKPIHVEYSFQPEIREESALQGKADPKNGSGSKPSDSHSAPKSSQSSEYPLSYKLDTVGVVKIDIEHSRATFIPAKPVQQDSGPIQNFLLPRILEPMKSKHGLRHTLQVRDGVLESFTITPLPTAEQLSELMTGTGWAFAKAVESKS